MAIRIVHKRIVRKLITFLFHWVTQTKLGHDCHLHWQSLLQSGWIRRCDHFYDSTQQNCRLCKDFQNSPTVSSFVELSFESDHITRRDGTQQNSFVELDWVGRFDHFKDSTAQNCFVELGRVGRSDRGFRDSVTFSRTLQSCVWTCLTNRRTWSGYIVLPLMYINIQRFNQ